MATKKKKAAPVTAAQQARNRQLVQMLMTSTVEGIARAAGIGEPSTLADAIDSVVRKPGTRVVADQCTAKLTHPRRNRWECVCADAGVKLYVEIDDVDDAPEVKFCVCCGATAKNTDALAVIPSDFRPMSFVGGVQPRERAKK